MNKRTINDVRLPEPCRTTDGPGDRDLLRRAAAIGGLLLLLFALTSCSSTKQSPATSGTSQIAAVARTNAAVPAAVQTQIAAQKSLDSQLKQNEEAQAQKLTGKTNN